MKAREIMNDIIGAEFTAAHPDTVDTLKFGDGEKEVKKIATCLCATPHIIEECAKWGADLVIVHEPLYYNQTDEFTETPLTLKKRAALEKLGAAVYRWHDSAHFRSSDKISLSFMEKTGLYGDFDGDMRLKLAECDAVSARSLARLCAEKLCVRHPRIVGDADFAATDILLALGMRGDRCFKDFLEDDSLQIAVCGELCEWSDCEPVREAAQFGINKAIVILGHAGSEKFAMDTLAREINGKYGGAPAKYFDCGEVYTYAD